MRGEDMGMEGSLVILFYVDVLPCLIMRVKLDSIQISPSFPFVTAGSCLSRKR